MEQFVISTKRKQLSIKTPLLKGNGNIQFEVYRNDQWLLTITPQMAKTSRINWVCTKASDNDTYSLSDLQPIGKAIEKYYLRKEFV